jgi:hypothetical protein
VRSTPAFAMINKDKMLKKAEPTNYTQLGISNYQLAIKPKESPRNSPGGLVPPPPPSSAARFSFAPSNYQGASLTAASGEVRAGGGQYYKARPQLAILNDTSQVVLNDADMNMKSERQDLRAKRKEKNCLVAAQCGNWHSYDQAWYHSSGSRTVA